MVNISVSRVTGMIVVLVGIGVLLCLGWVDSDLVYPISRMAEYQRNQVELQRQARQDAIDMYFYAISRAVQTRVALEEAQETLHMLKTRNELQTQWEREWAALKLELFRWGTRFTVGIIGLCLLVLAVGAGVYIVRYATLVPAPVRTDVWTTDRRRRAIEMARKREREERMRRMQYDAIQRHRDAMRKSGEALGSNGGSNGNINQEVISPFSTYD